jgi:hypothetical protein
MEGVGVSTGGRASPRAAAADAAVDRAEGGLPPEWREGFTRVGAANFPSLGHAAGRWSASVWANPAARQAIDAPDASLPVGAAFVQEHFELAGDGGAGPIMMMEKRPPGFDPAHGDMRWVVVTSAGETAHDGPAPSCSGCHDDAPRDRYFPIK